MLEINNLTIKINNKIIINNLNLIIKKGEIHILMGNNGTGKSTLVNTLAGFINVNKGSIYYNNKNLNKLNITNRAREGIFVSFQYPIELPGITNKIFLYNSLNSIYRYNNKKELDNFNLLNLIKKKINQFKILLPDNWLNNYVNVGLSGGQKKKNDILQMLILEPKLCILDEIDSGLDLETITLLSKIINFLNIKKKVTFIIITHYENLINHFNNNYIHILKNGNILHNKIK